MDRYFSQMSHRGGALDPRETLDLPARSPEQCWDNADPFCLSEIVACSRWRCGSVSQSAFFEAYGFPLDRTWCFVKVRRAPPSPTTRPIPALHYCEEGQGSTNDGWYR